MDTLYFDEVYRLMKQIKKRKLGEIRTLLAISENPHRENPQLLWEELNKEENPTSGLELDRGAFEILKQKMRDNPRIIVK